MANFKVVDDIDRLNEELEKYKSLSREAKKQLMGAVREVINKDRAEFNRRVAGVNCDLSKLNLILGATRAGKSTLFNFINGFPMVAKKVNDRLVIDVDEGKVCGEYAKIGHTYVSETTIPNFAKSAASEWTFVDCAGEFDTKSTLQSIINSYFKVDLAEKAKEVRLTLVIPESNITPSGSGYFRQVLNEIGKFISDWKAFENSRSVSLVVTHVKPGTQKDYYIRELRNMVSEVRDLGVFANVLTDVCNRGAVGLFNAPHEADPTKQKQLEILQKFKGMNVPYEAIKIACDLLSEEEIKTGKLAAVSAEPYNPPNSAKDIVAAIESGTKPLIKTDNQELFSMSVQPRVQSVIEVIVDDLTESLNDKISELMLHKVEDKVIAVLRLGNTVDFASYLQSVEKSECIKDVCDNLGLGEDNDLKIVVKDLEDFRRLSCAATDTFKYLKLRLMSELRAMKDSYEKDTNFVTFEQCNDQTLEIVGINVKSSYVMSKVTQNTKFIRIVCYYCMTFDCDMKAPTASIAIVSNVWNIASDRTIDISGCHSNNVSTPGTASGHFYAFVNHIHGSGTLTVIANGGNGASGSKGAQGDPIYDRASDAPFPSRPSRPSRKPDVNNLKPFGGYVIYYFNFNNYSTGRQGNRGYKGSKGGDSGSRGQVSIIQPGGSNQGKLRIINRDGYPGPGGDGGDGGRGQENGRARRGALVIHWNEVEWKNDGTTGGCTGYGPDGPPGDRGDEGRVGPMREDSQCKLSQVAQLARDKMSLFKEKPIIGVLCNQLIQQIVRVS